MEIAYQHRTYVTATMTVLTTVMKLDVVRIRAIYMKVNVMVWVDTFMALKYNVLQFFIPSRYYSHIPFSIKIKAKHRSIHCIMTNYLNNCFSLGRFFFARDVGMSQCKTKQMLL